LIVIF